MSPTAMETLTTVFTQVVTWMTTLLTTITGNPILLLGIAIFAVGAAIGLARRLIGA